MRSPVPDDSQHAAVAVADKPRRGSAAAYWSTRRAVSLGSYLSPNEGTFDPAHSDLTLRSQLSDIRQLRRGDVIDALETIPSQQRTPQNLVAPALLPASSTTAPASAQLFTVLTDEVAACILSLSAGTVDVIGYLGLFAIFVSNVTGDLVSAAAATANSSAVVSKLEAVAVFFAASGVAALIGGLMRLCLGAAPRQVAIALLALELLALGSAWVSGTIAPPLADEPEGWPVLVLVFLLAFAMGVQNGTQREPGVFVTYPPTTAQTAVLCNVATSAVHVVLLSIVTRAPGGGPLPADLAAGNKAEQRRELQSLRKFAPPLLAFTAGAALGAVLQHYIAFHALCLPCLGIGVLLLDVSLTEGRGFR